ncbi:anti-sigma factor [Pseudomonas azotoformans]|uniref:Anti-sigma factor n=1 Tax=Pseudomonas azotoformans TaxID=47878 RepID=A0A1V2JM18_PSEAZ|nr:anti-sigma factor [Pseudomonas azotoformans]OIN48202.1 anti-sigma factor [Pseudomonas azotoformans]ONH45916.1 anti-sigma factor [Pseudomonas azotoformans]SDO15432.1 Anti-sigma-K factor RskA [Pseudomonas azotoformans]
MNYQTIALRRALAADYAIGLMPATARRRFDALLLEDAALRVELGHWQDALASLTGALPERAVPAHVWEGIKARIEPQVLHVPAKKPFWMNLRLLAAAFGIVIAVLVGVLYQRDLGMEYNATLVAANQQPALQIKTFADHLQVEPLTLAAIEPTRALELWAIPAGGKPISLGLVPVAGKGRIALNKTQQALLKTPLTLAVSLEPQGGSPTGQPTGPVLYQGQLASL